jgi:hypothetical protein
MLPAKFESKEIKTYQQFADNWSYAKVGEVLGHTYHDAQQEMVSTFDDYPHISNVVFLCGRRLGKTYTTADIATGELFIPYASVLLVSPTYTNSKNLFKNVMKNIRMAGIKITSQNTNQLEFSLENGATFVSATTKSIDNVLGGRYSLVIFDESQSIPNLKVLFEQSIEPAMADYGVKENGTPYAKAMFLGTPRAIAVDFKEYFYKHLTDDTWKSFNYPTSANPLIPTRYIENKRASLPDWVFRQEYLAQWITVSSQTVFFAFDYETHVRDLRNDPKIREAIATGQAFWIGGLDIGFQDSTGYLSAIVLGNAIYILAEYSANKKTTDEHILNIRSLEKELGAKNVYRYVDPSAAQSAFDMASKGLGTIPAENAVVDGIDAVNIYFSETKKHGIRLYVDESCVELIRQLQLMLWKDYQAKTVVQDPQGTHWDLALACIRYMVYTWELQKSGAGLTLI